VSELKPGDLVWIGPVKVWQREWIRCCFEGDKDCVGGPVMRWECHIPDERHGIGIPINGIDHDATVPDHPALPAVARWLAEHPDALGALMAAAVFCLDGGGEIVYDDPAYQRGLVDAARSLLAALEPTP
jgi:hypothetical protein